MERGPLRPHELLARALAQAEQAAETERATPQQSAQSTQEDDGPIQDVALHTGVQEALHDTRVPSAIRRSIEPRWEVRWDHPRGLSAEKQKAADKVIKSMMNAARRAYTYSGGAAAFDEYQEAIGVDDVTAYVDYLEKQFEPGMTWANHGPIKAEGGYYATWQIDHKKEMRQPGAAGGKPTKEEWYARLHYTNTRPIWNGAHLERNVEWEQTHTTPLFY